MSFPSSAFPALPTQRSQELFARAQAVTPGGVNSPVRAFRSVGGAPRFIASASGSRLSDVDGNGYLDYVGSWGPMILGHSAPTVTRALTEAVARGSSYGAPTEGEVELAELVCCLTGAQKLRFVNSGTEATMSALRLARGFTGRKYILKFRGNYHGHADPLLVEAGSGLMTHAQALGASAPGSAGVPPEYASLTLVADYNDAQGLRQLLAARGEELAAIIFEPVVGNSGVLLPGADFLEALHSARDYGCLLIADEVMTGFRLSLGGATQRLGLRPDLLCWGKIIGGGLPVGAYGGRAEIMDCVSPLGAVYQAGTLSGNPLAMAAGLATLRELEARPDIYVQLEQYGTALAQGLREAASQAGVAVVVNQLGSMLTVFFGVSGRVSRYEEAAAADISQFATWFQAMLAQGVYWAPSQFESVFVSAAHTESDLRETLRAAERAFAALA